MRKHAHASQPRAPVILVVRLGALCFVQVCTDDCVHGVADHVDKSVGALDGLRLGRAMGRVVDRSGRSASEEHGPAAASTLSPAKH